MPSHGSDAILSKNRVSGGSLVAKTSRLLFALAYAVALAGAAQAQMYSVLHSLQYFPHGAAPDAPLYRGAEGNLYGTASGGGPYHAGVAFRLDTAGTQMVLHTFTGGADGGAPGAGVVYKIDTSGQFTALYSFKGAGVSDGANPIAGVTADAAGNLYGTTYSGGVYTKGTVYKLTPLGPGDGDLHLPRLYQRECDSGFERESLWDLAICRHDGDRLRDRGERHDKDAVRLPAGAGWVRSVVRFGPGF